MADKGNGEEGVEAPKSYWTNLPKELLELIAERLCDRIDVLRFSAICRLWRYSSRNLPRRFLHEVPALMVSKEDQTIWNECYTNEAFVRRPCVLFYTRTVYLAQQKNNNSADGSSNISADRSSNRCWLIWFREKPVKDEMHLEYLPKTVLSYPCETIPKELNLTELSVSELCKYYTSTRLVSFLWLYSNNFKVESADIRKIALIFSRSVAGEYAAVGLYGNDGKLAFLKSSREGIWTSPENYEPGYNDVIDYNGRFYAVHHSGKLLKIDLSSKVTEIASPILNGTGGIQKILVDSAGDLLLLDKFIDITNKNKIRETTSKTFFKVYKLNEEQVTHKMIEILSLGDRMLFLSSEYCSYSVSAQHFPGSTPNCIYLKEQCENAYHMDSDLREHLNTGCFGMFNLGNGTYKRIKDWCARRA